jgi:hypothetical protein
MTTTHIRQIFYNEATRARLDPAFIAFDNMATERPDWREFWPIRRFLLSEPLVDEHFYGFLSPKFRDKTNLSSADVYRFIAACDARTEVVLFSPSIHASAYYLNVFMHGEAEHPGLLDVSQRLLERGGQSLSLRELVSDSSNTVFATYLVARPRFWRAWLALNEPAFASAEDANDPVGAALRAPTSYGGRVDVPMKVFVVERMTSLVLAIDPSFVTRVHNPFATRKRAYKLPFAIVNDALKIAYRKEGHPQYLDVFRLLTGLRAFLNLQIRLGAFLGVAKIRPYVRALAAYWSKGPR